MNRMNETQYLTPDDTSLVCVDVWSTTSVYVNAAVSGMFVFSQTTCIAGGVWIIRTVGKHATQSLRSQQMHLQLTKLLVVQVKSGQNELGSVQKLC